MNFLKINKMYIVWVNHKKYENSGYYVCYQDKLSDKFSKNWIEAKKYTTLGNALKRLRIDIENYHIDFKRFFESYSYIDSQGFPVGFDMISALRDFNLNSIGIGEEKYPLEYFILKSCRMGYLMKILPDNTLVDCWDEVYQFVRGKIEINYQKLERHKKAFDGFGNNYLEKGNEVSDEEFWNTL